MREDGAWLPGPETMSTRALTLLVTGLTDEAVARRLDVSRRTVQRMVRSLMDGAGARSRMQLGHRAARAGLVAPSAASNPAMWSIRHPATADLRLLALMLADARADRVLGVSPRSVERRVREVMALAGARSRVQLGWVATRWGWI